MRIAAITIVLVIGITPTSQAQEQTAPSLGPLRDHIIFAATFDGTTSAVVAAGDDRLFTAQDSDDLDNAVPGLNDPDVSLAKGRGLVGDALQFKKKDRQTIFYSAEENMGYSADRWSGCVSFWLQLDPATDLEPGYCDPIQITDSGYNDAAIWVDFTKDNPRDFRLGVIGDLKSWNPENKSPDNNPEFEQRLVTVTNPPFSRAKWTHVLINFSGLNTNDAQSDFFLDGTHRGTLDVGDPFTWQEENARILLGLNYVGLMDELVIFDRPLSSEEVATLYQTEGGIQAIPK